MIKSRIVGNDDEHNVALRILLNDFEDLYRYDRIRLYRSDVSEGGPYEAITDVVPRAPLLPYNVLPPTQVSTTTRIVTATKLSLDITNYGVTRSLAIALSGFATDIRNVAQAIVAADPQQELLAWVDINNNLAISSKVEGPGSRITLTGGSTTALGLPSIPPDSESYGMGADLTIIPNQLTYLFTDPSGTSKCWYKFRLRNSISGDSSGYSQPMKADEIRPIDAANSVVGFVRLADLSGKAINHRMVTVFNSAPNVNVDGYSLVGPALQEWTDTSGYASFSLIRGTIVDVTVTGTQIVRRVKVPMDTSIVTFNLLDSAYGDSDAYDVQRPVLDYAIRRSV